MQVGLCELTFFFHGAATMRDKRAQLRRMIDRTRQRHIVYAGAEQRTEKNTRILPWHGLSVA